MNKNKYNPHFNFALLLVVFGFTTFAQETQKLDLKQAIERSIKNSKQLKISKAKSDDATAVVQAANDSKLPNFNLSANYLRLGFANIDLKTSGTSGGGGGAAVNPTQAMYGLASLSLPLYAGGKIKYGIESAQYLQKAVALDAETDRQAVVYNTTSAYINLYKAQGAVTIVKANLDAALTRDSSLSSLEKNGILTRNDFLKAQLQTSNIELALLEATNNLNLATVNMNLLLGQPENTVIFIDPAFLDIKDEQRNFADFQSLALQNRKDLQAIAYRKKAATTAVKSAEGEAYPTIALTGGYIAAHVPDVLTITNAVNLGLGVQYNLASLWKKNTKLLQAKARETQVNVSEEILNDVVKLQVNQDYQNYILSKNKIAVYEKAIIQATENVRITNNKYNNSLATISELLEADVALLQTKLNIQAAKADAVGAYQKLLQTTGIIN